ncbi:hypothetical protein ELQ87_09475 [Streptomyces griseoviridis]|uniref:Uncharacterized protein n=1 Tax=Streptomyces griseoviridis TaxID=45398 RepID=A0A3S9ZQ15_STRGD|nr:hypothetical protein ELQ87_09475 [Streptomyces griseoviridis]QCN88654.1 hypothetical protein DDJ31_29845 [Streptomyces griseoviridis]
MSLSTRSVIARPTATGYAGTYVHWDGYPSHHLPLLLTAHQHRFADDTEALAAYLIDDAPQGWSSLGTDLLDGAPDALRDRLAAGRDRPGKRYPARLTVPPLIYTERTASRLNWGYVLHPHGIEVISAPGVERGPLVAWSTDPRVRLRDTPGLWKPDQPIPATTPPQTTARTCTPAPAAARPAPTSAPAPLARSH